MGSFLEDTEDPFPRFVSQDEPPEDYDPAEVMFGDMDESTQASRNLSPMSQSMLLDYESDFVGSSTSASVVLNNIGSRFLGQANAGPTTFLWLSPVDRRALPLQNRKASQ